MTKKQCSKFKYNFIVHPGGNSFDIKLQFAGANKTSLTNEGSILIETAYGNIEESIPYTYQLAKNNQQLKTEARFHELPIAKAQEPKANIFGIRIDNYNPDQILVIDPSPWATYFGGNGEDMSFGLSNDGNGNILASGRTSSSSSIASSGAFQTSFGGNYDGFIVKFSSTGTRLWATYLGGSGDESAIGITFNSNDVFVTGSTGSTSGIATTGTYQTTGDSTGDAFLARFNSSGARQWATYYGGNSDEGGFSIAVDTSGNIFITGVTRSTSGIATSGAYQTSYAGVQDGFIAKFNSSGTSCLWATYYGGAGMDYGSQIAIEINGDVLICGATTSTTSIATSGAYQATKGGYNDAYIVKFNPYGVRIWATYYGGSSDDGGDGFAIDLNGNITLCGYTASTSGIATSSAYQTTYGGNMDVFIVKFNSSGNRLWGTYFGGSGNEFGNGSSLAIDTVGNIYLAGTTSSTATIATTGAYQVSLGGGTDAFIAKFNSSGSKQWATYYGGSGNETAERIIVNSNVFISGWSNSSSGMTTSGAHQTTFGGGTNDAFIASFSHSGSLPVKLISFDAKLQNEKQVVLNWQTASEVNNNYFELERASVISPQTTDDSWVGIGKIKGNRTTNTISNYEFIDAPAPLGMTGRSVGITGNSPAMPGITYYRLKQFDFDGSFSYSKIVSVNLKEIENEITVFPNPSNQTLFIKGATANISVYDLQGKLVLRQNGANEVDISALPKGLYFLKSGQGQKALKFVKE